MSNNINAQVKYFSLTFEPLTMTMVHFSPYVPFRKRWSTVLARSKGTTIGVNGALGRQMCGGVSNLIESALHIFLLRFLN